MKNRRGFLAALTVASGVAAGLPMSAAAQVGDAGDPPTSAPVRPAAQLKAPSAAALAFAATCRAFDPALSDAELETIARAVDDSRAAASTLDPKTRPLRNGDDLVVRFVADASA